MSQIAQSFPSRPRPSPVRKLGRRLVRCLDILLAAAVAFAVGTATGARYPDLAANWGWVPERPAPADRPAAEQVVADPAILLDKVKVQVRKLSQRKEVLERKLEENRIAINILRARGQEEQGRQIRDLARECLRLEVEQKQVGEAIAQALELEEQLRAAVQPVGAGLRTGLDPEVRDEVQMWLRRRARLAELGITLVEEKRP